MILTAPIEVYSGTNVRKNFVTTNLWQSFKLSHPTFDGSSSRSHVHKIKLLSYLVRNNMETYYSCTWLSFINQSNKKIRNWSLLMKIVSTVPKLLFFKTTDLYTVYLFSEYTLLPEETDVHIWH